MLPSIWTTNSYILWQLRSWFSIAILHFEWQLDTRDPAKGFRWARIRALCCVSTRTSSTNPQNHHKSALHLSFQLNMHDLHKKVPQNHREFAFHLTLINIMTRVIISGPRPKKATRNVCKKAGHPAALGLGRCWSCSCVVLISSLVSQHLHLWRCVAATASPESLHLYDNVLRLMIMAVVRPIAATRRHYAKSMPLSSGSKVSPKWISLPNPSITPFNHIATRLLPAEVIFTRIAHAIWGMTRHEDVMTQLLSKMLFIVFTLV